MLINFRFNRRRTRLKPCTGAIRTLVPLSEDLRLPLTPSIPLLTFPYHPISRSLSLSLSPSPARISLSRSLAPSLPFSLPLPDPHALKFIVLRKTPCSLTSCEGRPNPNPWCRMLRLCSYRTSVANVLQPGIHLSGGWAGHETPSGSFTSC